jgi:hypothetical protein
MLLCRTCNRGWIAAKGHVRPLLAMHLGYVAPVGCQGKDKV